MRGQENVITALIGYQKSESVAMRHDPADDSVNFIQQAILVAPVLQQLPPFHHALQLLLQRFA